MEPPEAVHTGLEVKLAVTDVVPERVNATVMPPVVYPLAFACSFVTPAYVVDDVDTFDVDRNSAHLYVSVSMSNWPCSIFVLVVLVKVHAPAAISSSYLMG
jgi:hypothetical protein